MVWNAELAQELIEAMEQARQQAGGGSRPGARSQQQEQQDVDNEPVGEQSSLDEMLGPMGEGEGGERQGPVTGEQLRQGIGQVGGQGVSGQGVSGQGEPTARQQSEPTARQQSSEMHNSGNGRVMMRFPFKDVELGEQLEGRGPGSRERDINSQAMFYPMPVPKYPDKQVQTDN